MSPGIPPSLDRNEQRATIFVGGLIVAAMFIGMLFVVVGRTGTGLEAGDEGLVSTGSERLDDYLLEEERASAYQALRDHLDQMKDEPGYEAVFCRDTNHHWMGDGEIEIEGQVDFLMETGEMASHVYVARLHGSRQAGWEVLSVNLEPIGAELE